ncbi:hypothetical protein DCM91_04595 [Chitinophaga costaii]|nr:hypothetical protein DCM91_04595 [Chitinophaga costaii]
MPGGGNKFFPAANLQEFYLILPAFVENRSHRILYKNKEKRLVFNIFPFINTAILGNNIS